MRKIVLIIINFIFFSTYTLPAQENEQNAMGDLKVIIGGFKNEKGKVLVALANNKEIYDSMHESYKHAIDNIVNKQVEITFNDLPFGEYAIKVFHDENDDRELNTNFLGIPTEDYGFSNNARGSFGPASWQNAKFKLDSAFYIVEIKLQWI